MRRLMLGGWCVAAAIVAGAFGLARQRPGAEAWTEVGPGVFRSPGPVASYALVDGSAALLVDAAVAPGAVRVPGEPRVEAVLLTHYHRPTTRFVQAYLNAKVPVRTAPKSLEHLAKDAIAKYWKEAFPLRSSRTTYLMPPVGFDGLDATLAPGKAFLWRGWTIEPIDAPGPARVQTALAARKGDGPRFLFVGGACAGPGTVFAPYATDWDHWTDAGLKPLAQTLDLLATRAGADKATLCPTFGPVVPADRAVETLAKTAAHAREAGFLKSFERYTKERLKNPPQYPFLAKEQAESNGSKPWSRVSEHLYLTGNTYVLVSKDGPCLMVDPWGLRSVEQWAKLRNDKDLGPLEVVWFSHAHYDHYDGVYDLPNPKTFETWTLDLIAGPLVEPLRWKAPFLDPRPVRVDRRPKDGDTLAWREYRFRFSHQPGQSLYTMGVETVIDGKKCFFTADNFYHQDMFAGTGGWMGLNRAFPPYYAASAQAVLNAAPDWILAEHGGPFAFDAEDWRRRVAWAEAAGKAIDSLAPSGAHRHDYNPHLVHIEPAVIPVRAGDEARGTLTLENQLGKNLSIVAVLEGRAGVADATWNLSAAAGTVNRLPITVRVPATLAPGRHAFAVHAAADGALLPADAVLVLDVAP